MSALTDRIAAEHRDALYIDTADAIICKGCGEIIFDTAHHIAAVTESAVREEIAREIEATRGEHLRWYGNQLLSLAARIARGDRATLQRLREEQTP